MSAPGIRPIALAIIRDQGRILVFEGRDPLKPETFYRPLGGGIEFGERGAEALRKAGVKVALSDGLGNWGAADARNLPYHAAQCAAFGMPPDEALKAITLAPAEILGVADRLGSIDAGKEASLIAVDGDLLDIRSHVTRMWIAGEETSLESRHTRLYEKYRGRPKPETK